MNVWEFALFAAAAYVAIVTLARMMRRRHDALVDELSQAAEAERRRLRAEERAERRLQMREKIKQEQAGTRRAA